MSTGKADDDGRTRAKRFHRSCRGIGDGMHAQGIRRNTGSPDSDPQHGIKLATRER